MVMVMMIMKKVTGAKDGAGPRPDKTSFKALTYVLQMGVAMAECDKDIDDDSGW